MSKNTDTKIKQFIFLEKKYLTQKKNIIANKTFDKETKKNKILELEKKIFKGKSYYELKQELFQTKNIHQELNYYDYNSLMEDKIKQIKKKIITMKYDIIYNYEDDTNTRLNDDFNNLYEEYKKLEGIQNKNKIQILKSVYDNNDHIKEKTKYIYDRYKDLNNFMKQQKDIPYKDAVRQGILENYINLKEHENELIKMKYSDINVMESNFLNDPGIVSLHRVNNNNLSNKFIKIENNN